VPVFRKLILATTVAALMLALFAASALARSFEGKVVAKNSDARTFKLRQDEGGGTFKFKVTANTTFQDLAGFGAIKVGQKRIEVVASHKNGRWIASHVERSGGGGGNGGGGGGDNGGGHGGGADDPPGHG
jgi:uncharacterized membrane protein YgcG